MEEIAKLRAKVVASMSASVNPNSKVNKESLKSKEEGELSSSTEIDEEVHTSSAGQSTSTTPSPVDLNVIPPSKHTQNPEKGCHPAEIPGYVGFRAADVVVMKAGAAVLFGAYLLSLYAGLNIIQLSNC